MTQAKQYKVTIKDRRETNQFYREQLPGGVELRMMSIPGGTFLMGSPETERDRVDWEGPQHEVTVPAFYLGKYPVTQAQWQAIAVNVAKVGRDLKPDPAKFKGSDRPVEQVSWEDAVEFCDRLTQHTGREYRLPSEAEWEYACRAGTTTPFHFGETITTDLANYRGTDNESIGWSGSYGEGPKGEYRQETTPVGSFDAANRFGLLDMHGNVWEWCQDDWYGSYAGAPTDGTAWLSDRDRQNKVMRGGSWNYDPRNCRSVYRDYFPRGYRLSYIGFRVACGAPRT